MTFNLINISIIFQDILENLSLEETGQSLYKKQKKLRSHVWTR
jgi:hypothetical protein